MAIDTKTQTGTWRVKSGLAQMVKGGVIMDVVTADQAKIAEDAGAVAVMALERVPSDIRKVGGVARMSDPTIIDEIIAVNYKSTEEIDEQTEIKKEEITGTQITININTAGKDELVLLPNVVPVTAERIIRYREDYGFFDPIDDLTGVKGIGPKTLEKLKDFVTL